jgi:hypothetical protein
MSSISLIVLWQNQNYQRTKKVEQEYFLIIGTKKVEQEYFLIIGIQPWS